MNKIFILLDRSQSMETMWEEAIGGINGYVKAIEGDAEIMLAVFDSVGYDVIRNTTVKNWENLSSKEVSPRGYTPLLDASGRMMWNMIDSKAKRAILVVVTDGEENTSKKFSANEIRSMTKEITVKHDYEMVFLGANFDNIAEVAAQNFAWQDQSRVMPTTTRGFIQGMNATAVATSAYFGTGKSAVFCSDKVKAEAKL